MRKKGIVTMLEMIASVIVLFTAFSIFFPGFIYQSKWDEATLLLRARDFILTVDRLNLLNNFSFNKTALSYFAAQVLDPNLIFFTEIQGALKNELIVACNCTLEQIRNLSTGLGKSKFNDRDIFITFYKVDDLNNIPPSDALLIWTDRNLSPYYNSLISYLNKGSGILEIRDFRFSATGNPVDDDVVQSKIFGLRWRNVERDTVDYVEFNGTPLGSNDPKYGPYRYFHNFPLTVKTNTSESMSGCVYNPSSKGWIIFNRSSYAFWICNSTSVWFDTNGDGSRDILINIGSRFNLSSQNYTFSLNYIEGNFSISVSFKPTFKFRDFLGYIAPAGEPEPPGRALGVNRVYHVEPIDNDWSRVLLKGVSQNPRAEYPASIVNLTSGNRVAWVADLLGDANDDFDDDKKQIVLSLLLWVSNKVSKEPILGNLRTGYMTSYINIINKDMLELYRFNFILGFPY